MLKEDFDYVVKLYQSLIEDIDIMLKPLSEQLDEYNFKIAEIKDKINIFEINKRNIVNVLDSFLDKYKSEIVKNKTLNNLTDVKSIKSNNEIDDNKPKEDNSIEKSENELFDRLSTIRNNLNDKVY